MRRIAMPRTAAAAAGLLASALLLAACGGSSGGVAHLGKTKTSSSQTATSSPSSTAAPSALASAAIRFATCMRSHGVANFPDPGAPGGATSSAGATDPNSPAVKAAVKDCHSLTAKLSSAARALFGTPKAQAQFLAVAACMRSHGVPSFPDPKFVDGLPRFPGLKASDLHSLTFLAALQRCKSLLPGGGAGL